MADGYAVQHEAMAKGAAAVEDASALIAGHLRTLDSEVQAMFGGWQSQAQASFAALHASWAEQQRRLQSALVDMHAALVSTSQTYATQEQEQAAAFSHIAGQL